MAVMGKDEDRIVMAENRAAPQHIYLDCDIVQRAGAERHAIGYRIDIAAHRQRMVEPGPQHPDAGGRSDQNPRHDIAVFLRGQRHGGSGCNDILKNDLGHGHALRPSPVPGCPGQLPVSHDAPERLQHQMVFGSGGKGTVQSTGQALAAALIAASAACTLVVRCRSTWVTSQIGTRQSSRGAIT